MARPSERSHILGIVAYLSLVGWIIALIFNSRRKSRFASFHIRQALLLHIFTLLKVIPVVGWLVAIYGVIFIIVGLIQAIMKKMEPTPLIGVYAQKWFRGI